MSRFTPETIERVRTPPTSSRSSPPTRTCAGRASASSGSVPSTTSARRRSRSSRATASTTASAARPAATTIRFVQEKEGLAFPDAVEALAERYGVEVERDDEDPQAEEARRRRGRLGEALERVAAFYESFLWESPKAAKARDYLIEERGLGEEVLRSFGVGFAPSAWDQVLTRGQRAGFTVDELLAAGLIQRAQKSPAATTTASARRITFPVRDSRGRVLGFGARGAARRREAEVPELAGGRALPQEPHALRDRPGARGDRQAAGARSSSRGTPT